MVFHFSQFFYLTSNFFLRTYYVLDTVLNARKSNNKTRYGPCLHTVFIIVGETNIAYTNKIKISAVISALDEIYSTMRA